MFFVFSFLCLKFIPKDPLRRKQFTLDNNGFYSPHKGEDLDIYELWEDSDFNDSSVLYGIIGHGCYLEHYDLLNQRKDLHYNFDDKTRIVTPEATDKYVGYANGLLGLAIGESNNYCTVGVAQGSPFYCLKTTLNTSHVLYDAMRYYNNETAIKLIATPHRKSSITETKYFNFYPAFVDEEMDAIFQEKDAKPVFVSVASTGASSGADTNMFTETRDPNIIAVSDSTPNGGRCFWSAHGTSLLVNAPAGGSPNSIGKNIYKPSPPTTGIESPDQCMEDSFTPIGVGSSLVAGIAGLLKYDNQDLTAREVQYILALSATKNDPKHHSWTTNAAGFNYSNVYGFGRADAHRAIDFAEGFGYPPLPKLHSESVEFENMKLLPRGGLTNVTGKSESKIVFTEYLKLHFTAKSTRFLFLEIQSPSGTRATVVLPSLVKNGKGNYEYVVRNFFGESGHGTWTIRASNEGYSNITEITNISIEIHGCQEKPNLGLLPYSEGGDSQKLLGEQGEFEIKYDDDFTCGREVSYNITLDGEFDVFLYDTEASTRYQIAADVKGKTSQKFTVPCNTKTKLYQIYAEERETSRAAYDALLIPNPYNDSYIIEPKPYQRINMTEDKEVTIDIKYVYQSNYISNDAEARTLIVGLYDLDTNTTLKTIAIDRSESKVTFTKLKNDTYSHCVLFISPLLLPEFNGCDTLIQPISIVSADKEVTAEDDFVVPLSIHCPAPPGVKILPSDVPPEKIIPGSVARRIVYLSVFILLCVLLMVGITVWHFCFREKEGSQRLDSETLL